MVGLNANGRKDAGQSLSVAGRLVPSLFFLGFLALGSLFEWFTVRECGRALGQRSWDKTPCTIVRSEVRERSDNDKPFAFAVRYEFNYAGQSRTGTIYQRNYSASSTYSGAQKLARKYPAGRRTFCSVNPKNPDEVVLQRDSLTMGLVALFPLLFVLIGAGGLYFLWRPGRPKAGSLVTTAILRTGQNGKGRNRYVAATLPALFAVIGAAMLYPLGIKPLARTLAARSWAPTPCHILRAEVRSHSSDDGTTYSVYVLYQYEFQGRTYKSDRYGFVSGSSSGYEGKARLVQQYRTAGRPVCYVNPRDPTQAVLRRGFQAGLLVIFVPFVFLTLGLVGTYGVLRRKTAAVLPQAPALRPADDGLVHLKPKYSPFTKLLGAVLLAFVCNGINILMLSELIRSQRRGHLDGTLALMLVPFGAVGVGMLAFAAYRLLALFNPRPTLELSSNVIPLGGTAELRWSFRGRISRIANLTVTLCGAEETRYQRGTDTCTDRNTFYELELYRTSDASEIGAGQVGFAIPPDTMHSFEAANNKILWSLDLHGTIRHWPDVKESFRITVTPTTA